MDWMNPVPIEVDPSWHENYFDDIWLRVAVNFGGPMAAEEADFVCRALGLEAGMRVLDMPCGYGRHSIELARCGIAVTGVDSSPASIRVAADAARAASLGPLAGFQVGDMRTFALADPADAVIVLQDSIGLMADDEQNLQVLRNIRRSLVPGGKLLIDVVNLFHVIRAMIAPRQWARLADGTVYAEEREYDFRAGRLLDKIELFTPEGEHFTRSSSVRIYTLPEFDAMLRAAGYQISQTYGGFDGSPYGGESMLLIVVAERTSS